MTIYSELAQRALNALEQDPRTRESAIKVVDVDGIVTLRGVARSEEARSTAEGIVRKLDGVVKVMNELEVKRVDRSPISSQAVPPEENPGIEG